MHRTWLAAVTIFCMPVLDGSAADPNVLLELQIDGRKRTGAVVANDAANAWFLERDGRLDTIDIARVKEFRPLGKFRPFSAVEMRERLAKELGPQFRVTTTGQYIVAGPPESVERLAPLFEGLYRDCLTTFSSRGVKVQPPSTPLVALILADRSRFEEYCKSEKVTPQPGLRGFYLPSSNRVALYDTGQSSGLDATILHEATHQVAFNIGIHSRLGVTPKWVVEGLATAFEREAFRLNDRRSRIEARVNPERYAWFQRLRKERYVPRTLGQFLQSDRNFEGATLDAYSQAWALTFFLMETRPAEYAAYLRQLTQRDPLADYPGTERQQDFEKAFGRDLLLLETHFLRFFQNLERGVVLGPQPFPNPFEGVAGRPDRPVSGSILPELPRGSASPSRMQSFDADVFTQ